jgi:hypothetical protein
MKTTLKTREQILESSAKELMSILISPSRAIEIFSDAMHYIHKTCSGQAPVEICRDMHWMFVVIMKEIIKPWSEMKKNVLQDVMRGIDEFDLNFGSHEIKDGTKEYLDSLTQHRDEIIDYDMDGVKALVVLNNASAQLDFLNQVSKELEPA